MAQARYANKTITCEVIQMGDSAAIVHFPQQMIDIVTKPFYNQIINDCNGKSALWVVNYLTTKWGWYVKTENNNKYVLEHPDEIGGFMRDFNILKEYEKNIDNY